MATSRQTPDSEIKYRIMKVIEKQPGMICDEICSIANIARSTCKNYLRWMLNDEILYCYGVRDRRGGKDINEYAILSREMWEEIHAVPVAPRDPLICALIGI